MAKSGSFIEMMLPALLLMTGCSAQDSLQEEENANTPVVVDLALSVSKDANSVNTRMLADNIQATDIYRGFSLSRLVPFGVQGEISVYDEPLTGYVSTSNTEYQKTDVFYLYDNCYVMPTTASFLVYGKAPRGSLDKASSGSVIENFPEEMNPVDIHFELESIVERTVHPAATSLADYLTAIATAKGNDTSWKDAPSATLRVMYLNFINCTEQSQSGTILPGSSANVYNYALMLRDVLESLSLTNATDIAIRTAIIDKINAYDHSLDNFPAFEGLPDGAAVIRWNGTEFVPQPSNTQLADINGIDRFAYPAEICYYANSRISTSNLDDRKDSYDNKSRWSDVLADYENSYGTVTPNTTSIAIKDPLQYGVARMQIRLKKTDSSSLKDANGADVPVGEFNFPLTGVIVGGQMPVGFDFAPTTSYPVYSETDMKYIYDSQVNVDGISDDDYFYLSSSADAIKCTNTLVLQSYDHKKVPIVLEFMNDSPIDFKGFNGIVLRRTKFYLVGEIDPSDFSGDPRTEIRDRVFTQDYITTLNLKVVSLEKAYNVVPNLLSPRLEIGVQLVSKWVSTTPGEIVF